MGFDRKWIITRPRLPGIHNAPTHQILIQSDYWRAAELLMIWQLFIARFSGGGRGDGELKRLIDLGGASTGKNCL